MPIINYAEETIKVLSSYNYTIDDIDWIGNETFIIPIHEFFDIACHTNYNRGYGRPVTPGDIIIMMKDQTWFSRWEYDGSEGWEHHKPYLKPTLTAHVWTKSFNYQDENLSIDHWAPYLCEYCA